MLSLLLPFAVLAVASAQNYASQFEQEFGSTVTPPFRQAVTTYQTNILQHIATLSVDSINKDPSAVAKDLNCNTQKLKQFLKQCVTASDQLKTKMDQTVVTLTTSASNYQTQLNSLNAEQVKNQQTLTSLNSQIAQANAQVQQAVNGLNAAQATLNKEQQDYDRARESCVWHKKKRFHLGHIIHKITHPITHTIDKITKPITKPIQKAICHTLNHGGIDRANDARNRAQTNVNNAQARLSQLQTSAASIQSHIGAVNADIQKVNNEKSQVSSQLSQVTTQRNAVAVVDTQVKQAEAKASTFLGSAEVLGDVVNKMVDFNGLIVPLNSIAQQLATFKQSPSLLVVPPTTLTQVTNNLKLLQSKLPSFPFVENVPGC